MADTDDDDGVLRDMLALADKLCTSDDALLVGQYQHLRSRIDALIELRAAAAEAA